MTRSLSIPPEGPVMVSEEEPDALARQLLRTDKLHVVTARALGRDWLHVMHIDDYGATKPLPINRRAWALYGGSPIHGLAVLSADDGGPIDDEVIEMVSSTAFPTPEVLAHMERWLEAHG